jgi:ribosomal protein S18 acetylase RimI-like enzyme
MMVQTDIKGIRPYRDDDRDTVLVLAARLAVGIAPWRSADGMMAAARGWVEAAITGIGADQAIFIAEDDAGAVLGFVSVAKQTEFTGEMQAYIGELAVDASAEGQGIGQHLLAAAEAWAIEHGLPLLVLDTGAANGRARRFYKRNGFVDESVRLTKQITIPD